MNKKDIAGAVITGIGLSFIFCVATHDYKGILVGVAYILGFIISGIIKNK